MASRSPFEHPKPGWLPLEKACFGFEAQREGKKFSFSDTYALLTLPGTLLGGVHHGFDWEFMRTIFRVAVVHAETNQKVSVYTLDEISDFTSPSGETRDSALRTMQTLGIPGNMLARLPLAQKYLVQKLREAIDNGFARVHARIGSPLEPCFSEIPADSFRAFTVRQFHSGQADALDGSRLFGIHIAPEGDEQTLPPQPHELPFKQASFARFIIANHGGLWPDSPWKVLLSEFARWPDVQTSRRTSIGRSMAAALKARFPNGFLLDGRPTDKIGSDADNVTAHRR